MESAPVPPHERSWRHPSELSPTRLDLDSTDTGPARSSLPLLAGTVAIAVVVVLVVAMTPQARDDGDVAAVTTLPAFSTAPPVEAAVTSAAGVSTASFGFARLTAIPRAIAVTPSIAGDSTSPVADDAVVYVITAEAIYRTVWHELQVRADPAWLMPLGAAVVVTVDGHRIADIADGQLLVTGG